MRARARIAIRCDSGRALGFGHVKRCLVMADACAQASCEVRFVCRDTVDSYFRCVSSSYPVLWIDGAPASEGPSRERNLADARSTIAACDASAFRPDIVFVDQYELDHVWEREVRTVVKRVLAIEDYNERRHAVDYVLGASTRLRSEHYYADYASTTFLLGPEYLILSSEFERDGVGELGARSANILMFFGSTDGSAETEKTLHAIAADPELAARPGCVHVAIGALNPRRAAIEALLHALPGGQLSVQLPSLAPALRAAELFVTAGGNSMQEAVAMGKPCIVIGTARNQVNLCEEFERVPYVHYLGLSSAVDGAAIAAAIRGLPALFNQRIRPALLAHPVDTHGPERVVARLLHDHGL